MIFTQLEGFFKEYLGERKRLAEAIERQYAPKLKKKEEEMSRQMGRAGEDQSRRGSRVPVHGPPVLSPARREVRRGAGRRKGRDQDALRQVSPMRLAADLHLHSRHARATSREADLEGYYRWALVKGIQVVGTGDFTHPGWFSELSEKLVEKDGLYALKEPPRGSPLEGAERRGYAGALHAHHGDQLHLSKARAGAQGAQPDRRAHAGGRAEAGRAACRHRQRRLRRPADPRPGPQGPPVHPAGHQRRRLPHPRPRMDALVLPVRLEVGFRRHRGMLRGAHPAHLRAGDGALLRSPR